MDSDFLVRAMGGFYTGKVAVSGVSPAVPDTLGGFGTVSFPVRLALLRESFFGRSFVFNNFTASMAKMKGPVFIPSPHDLPRTRMNTGREELAAPVAVGSLIRLRAMRRSLA